MLLSVYSAIQLTEHMIRYAELKIEHKQFDLGTSPTQCGALSSAASLLLGDLEVNLWTPT